MAKTKNQAGICWLVGAGPGDPGLLTLRGRECLEGADAVVYDYLVSPEILGLIPEGAKLTYVGKQAGRHAMEQEAINALLVRMVGEGLRVVRLKGGDPFLFGRGGEEAAALAGAGLTFEIVPGVTSAIAGPAYAGIPVTHRAFGPQLTIFTGHEDPSKPGSGLDLAAIARAQGTRVMLMGVERIGEIARDLIGFGADPATPVALIRWATTPRQETLEGTIADIAERVAAAGFKPPAVAVIGGVVGLRRELAWFERRPLFGKRIVVTRTRAQAGALAQGLQALGAEVIEVPTIRIDPPSDKKAFRELVRDVHGYEWLVFTSPNGVDRFFDAFFAEYTDLREIGGVRIAAIGPATAARVTARHLAVDLVPERAVAEDFLERIKEIGSIDNLRVLIVRPDEARDVLARGLSAAGAIVDEAIAYRTVPEDKDPRGALKRLGSEERIDLVTFASSSAVANFLALKVAIPSNTEVASIGPVTSATLRERGCGWMWRLRSITSPG
jgi:uroporphyrinogen III methyltransferase/synthase